MKSIGIGNLKTAAKRLTRYERAEVPLPSHATHGAQRSALVPPAPLSPLQTTDYGLPTPPEGQLSVDVYQTETEIIILAPIAGTPPEELNLSITDDVITIKGTRARPIKKALNPEDIYLEECFWGNFSRSIILPAEVDTARVEARFKHNILTIRVPKVERIKTRKISIAQENE